MADVFMANMDTVLDAAELTALNAMSSDLRFMLSEFEVPDRVQHSLCLRGYKSLATFGVMADDRATFRAAVIADLLINPAHAGLDAQVASRARTVTAALIAAWQAAGLRQEEAVRQSVDNRLLRLPNLVSKSGLVALRQKYETEHGRVPDHLWPCASLVEKRLEEIEEGSFTAQPLTEIISLDKADDDIITIGEIGTNVRVRKAPKAISQPQTTEELRDRFTTMGITYILASYKHASRLWIRSATMEMWNKYVTYLLSDQVASYKLDQDHISVRASWTTVLSYDLAMRKLTCRSVLYDQQDFATALTAAMIDLGCRERHFITPTAMSTAASSSRRGNPEKPVGPAGDMPISNGKRKRLLKAAAKLAASKVPKGKGKGKGVAEDAKTLRTTPDGRNICKFYNLPRGCIREGCNFVHICNRCLGQHSGHGCAATAPA